jgi:hypothetical protein
MVVIDKKAISMPILVDELVNYSFCSKVKPIMVHSEELRLCAMLCRHKWHSFIMYVIERFLNSFMTIALRNPGKLFSEIHQSFDEGIRTFLDLKQLQQNCYGICEEFLDFDRLNF